MFSWWLLLHFTICICWVANSDILLINVDSTPCENRFDRSPKLSNVPLILQFVDKKYNSYQPWSNCIYSVFRFWCIYKYKVIIGYSRTYFNKYCFVYDFVAKLSWIIIMWASIFINGSCQRSKYYVSCNIYDSML